MQRILVIVLCFFVTACGSGGSGGTSISDSGTLTKSSKYIGSYIGTWSTDNQSGIAEIDVDKNGKLSGVLKNKTASSIATITSGSIDDAGNVNFVYKYSYDQYSGTVSASTSTNGNTITLSGSNNIASKNTFMFSQLVNKNATVDVTNNTNYWNGRFNYNPANIYLKQNGNNITGTFTSKSSYSNITTTGTVTGTISGSIISLTLTPNSSGLSTNFYEGIVSTGFYYADNNNSAVANTGGKCLLSYETRVSYANFINSCYVLTDDK